MSLSNGNYRQLIFALACVGLCWASLGCKQSDAKLPKAYKGIQMRNAQLWKKDMMLGGQVTRGDLKLLKQKQFRTIINLRTKGEMSWDEKGTVEKLGMKYISLPIAGAKGITKANAEKLDQILKDKKNYPLLLHCGSSNRVGGLLAVRAFFHHKKSKAEALKLGAKAGMSPGLGQYVASKLKK